MSPLLVSSLISIAGIIVSIMGAAIVVAFRAGGASDRLTRMEKDMTRMATTEQLAGVKEDLAEIKGMFKMTLKDGG
jgi:hypothetical protein